MHKPVPYQRRRLGVRGVGRSNRRRYAPRHWQLLAHLPSWSRDWLRPAVVGKPNVVCARLVGVLGSGDMVKMHDVTVGQQQCVQICVRGDCCAYLKKGEEDGGLHVLVNSHVVSLLRRCVHQ